jgi:uncharacterized membrane protein YphA (DoxX/SURF4 family)
VTRAARIACHCSRLLLGGIFLYAGAGKALDVQAFAGQVAAYRLLPEAGSVVVAVTLPYVEIVAGALLLLRTRVRAAALLLLALTIVFAAVLVSAIARGLDLDCGCFGAGRTSPIAALGRDAGILLLAAVTLALGGGTEKQRGSEVMR